LYIIKGAALQERVSDLEIAMLQLETMSGQKISEAVTSAAAEIKSIEDKKATMQASLFASQAELAITNQLKLQIVELTILESTGRTECLKLQQQVAFLSSSQEMLQSHLTTSR
jgi:hypothetical protein